MRVEDLGAEADGVANFEGRKIFVPLAAPGDVVECEIRGDRATIIDWVEKSPARVAPPCRHFGACGGCALQHLSREFGADWKLRRVRSELERAGLYDVNLKPVVLIDPASRRRATFVYDARRGFGFNARRSRDIVAIESCEVLHADLAKRLPALRNLAQSVGAASFDMAVTLCRNGLDVHVAGRGLKEPRGEALMRLSVAARAAGCVRISIAERLAVQFEEPVVDFDGVDVAPPPGGFLQAAREGEDSLRDFVLENVGGAKRALDLFSGAGAFALALARGVAVHAVDFDKASIEALRVAASRAQSRGLKLKAVTTEIRNLFESPVDARALDRYDAVVFDPPRSGAGAQARELAKSKVRVVVGISCDPLTFAHDAAILSQGGYSLVEAIAVDQFVYSTHIEVAGAFRRTR